MRRLFSKFPLKFFQLAGLFLILEMQAFHSRGHRVPVQKDPGPH